MGAYATLNGTEVKYSGLLAQAGSNIGVSFDNGIVSFTRSQVMDLAIELARIISDTRVQAPDIYTVRQVAMACRKLEAIVMWIDSNSGSFLHFA